MALLAWAILGLAAAVVARSLDGASRPAGTPATLGIGVLGAVLGGLVATAVGIGSLGSFFDPGAWLIALGGAFLLLMLLEALGAVRADHDRAAEPGEGAMT